MIWVDKQKNIVDFALSSLLRRWGKNISLVVVYTSIVFLLGSIVFLTHSVKKEASVVLEGSPEIVVQRLVMGRYDVIPASYVTKIVPLPGVQRAWGRLWGYYYEPATGANFTVMVPRSGLREGFIQIGKGLARTMNLEKGDTLPLKSYDGAYVSLEVETVFSESTEIVDGDLLLLSDADFRLLFRTEKNFFTDIVVSVKNPREISTVADKIRRIYPDSRPILKDEILRTYDAIFDWRSGLMILVFVGAILAFGIFAWDKATSMSIEEKREIGVLKALGWETSEVLFLKAWEGIIISFTAFLVGVSLAYLHVFFGSFALFMPVLKGWSVLYPSFSLVPFIDPYQISALFFLTVMPYTVATIVPAWHAAIIDPDEVMRS